MKTNKIAAVLGLGLLLALAACERAREETTGPAEAAGHPDEHGHAGEESAGGLEHEEGGDSTRIAADAARAAGLVTDTAGPSQIRNTLPLHGRIVPTDSGQRSIGARFPGQIRSVTRALGDTVKAGEVLARVESDDSLQVYAVTSPISGVVTARNANPGEQAGAAPLFVVTHLGSVWAELSVFPQDLPQLRPGQTARVTSLDGSIRAEGTLVSLSPAGTGPAQALTARVLLDNAAGRWTPGLYVGAEAVIGASEVTLAVKNGALQELEGATVVFEQSGNTYTARPLQLGRSDGEYTEVLGGLAAGARYVSGNSYLVKADIGKSGAAHEH
ncbi:HlyD family efflux transporter periplasmic adaptor subunit [Solimonas sp. K1W22B-7]|uniref:efflux RND transporter periplasmic adaptor subunit n=1 Tax=Solimonas sp. K1W22B-7 TaxID=2303331 RepID=UPI000E336169|nr:HlyD family efflux transporter periplasmic adaptor subunit [Solimonas sp. K1W22B-7]AXQ28849.1 HlyD family efflux transporter periplasmic adaptor subunit [Solimonas sp. K1W22B-7]